MKKLFIYSLLILQILLGFSVLGSSLQNNVVIGNVTDEAGVPVQNVKVSVAGSEFYISDAQGKFKMNPKKKLMMPFDIEIIKKGFKLEEFSFDDSDNELEVILKKTGQTEENLVTVRFFDKNLELKNAKVTIDGLNYTTDKRGDVSLKSQFSEKSKVMVEGYDLAGITYSEKEKIFKVAENKKAKGNVQTEIRETIAPEEENEEDDKEDTLSPQQLSEKVFKQYQGDFDELTNEIIAERIRVEGNNKKIRDEIVAITTRLQNEKNLTKEQRVALQKYVEKLENTLLENTIAFQKSQERTNFLISRLKNIIMEKDSINAQALKKNIVVEKKLRITERKAKRNLIVFSIITAALLLLAIVFYSIAVKMRKQRRALMKSNEEMQGIKDQLAVSLDIIEEQKKQLGRH
jgi:hypothetical protein